MHSGLRVVRGWAKSAVVLLSLVSCGLAPISSAQQKPVAGSSSGQDRGKQLFSSYCASCHGSTGKGDGPVASSLRTPPADLTSLSRKHGGKFPYDLVNGVIRGSSVKSSHGSGEMPVWGPIFLAHSGQSKIDAEQRYQSLVKYLVSLQSSVEAKVFTPAIPR